MEKEQPGIFATMWRYKFTFGIALILIFSASFSLLYAIGLIPEEFSGSTDSGVQTVADTSTTTPTATQIAADTETTSGDSTAPTKLSVAPDEPVRVIIPAVGDNTPVQNPETTDVNILDDLLVNGSIHYPGSAVPGQGNVFLFAHSTSIKLVHNHAYQAFDNIDKLQNGDEITVQTATMAYVYDVTSVTKLNEGLAKVNIADTRNMLTLTTCDTFSGIKQQRIIVEADFNRSYAL